MEKTNKPTNSLGAVAAIVLFVLGARILSIKMVGHPVSFAPMTALALFCGAYLGSGLMAFLLPFAAIIVSDQVLNLAFYGAPGLMTSGPFYPGWYWQYLCYALFVLVGALVKPNRSAFRIAGTSVAASLVFFLISNFGVWASTAMYPRTADGLIECLVMGLPFLKSAAVADLFFCAVFFGSFELLRRMSLRPVRA